MLHLYGMEIRLVLSPIKHADRRIYTTNRLYDHSI